MRNSSGLGSWVVFLAYFHLGSAFPKHPPTLAARAGLWGSGALGSFWEGVTFPPGGDPASYGHIKPSTKSPFQFFPVYYHWHITSGPPGFTISCVSQSTELGHHPHQNSAELEPSPCPTLPSAKGHSRETRGPSQG